MTNNYKIYTQYGEDRCVLDLDKTLLLNKRNGAIEIDLPESLNKWKLKIVFEHDNEKKEGVSNAAIENNDEIIIRCNKWYSDFWIENAEPYIFEDKMKTKKIYIKLRTTANLQQDFRLVIINIWKFDH